MCLTKIKVRHRFTVCPLQQRDVCFPCLSYPATRLSRPPQFVFLSIHQLPLCHMRFVRPFLVCLSVISLVTSRSIRQPQLSNFKINSKSERLQNSKLQHKSCPEMIQEAEKLWKKRKRNWEEDVSQMGVPKTRFFSAASSQCLH